MRWNGGGRVVPWKRWLIRAQSWARSSAVHFSRAVSPSVKFIFFWTTTFIAWKESSILFTESIIRLNSFAGKGPRSSNSWVAALRRLSRRRTV